MGVQRDQQAELRASQPRRHAVVHDVLGRVVEYGLISARCQGRRAVEGDPAQQCVYPRIQFRQAEGLGQVIVGAAGESGDAVLLGTQCRHEDHRYGLLAPQCIEQAQAIETWQHDVQQR